METLWMGLELARRVIFKAGPYLFLEALLPGGTLIALLLYWYRRRAKKICGILSI